MAMSVAKATPLLVDREPDVAPPAPRALWAAMAVGGLLAVILLGFLLVDDAPFAFDRAIILALRVPGDLARPIGPVWLHEAMIDLTALGGATVLTTATIAAVGLLLVRRLWLTALLVSAATISGSPLAAQAKHWVGRPRPELVDHLVQVHGLSFPSGHATNSAIAYLTLAGLVAQVERGQAVRSYTFALAVLLVGIIGISRVYLGVHWPSDVLAGWCAGTGWAALWWWIGAAARRRLSIRR
jgi:undecaprenyl-diphosphatase